MSSQKTEHYQLHKWESGDDFLRTEFNENFSILDGTLASHAAALAAKADQTALDAVRMLAEGKVRIVTGTYVGDDVMPRTIDLGVSPLAVHAEEYDGYRSSNAPGGGLFTRAFITPICTLTDTGFIINKTYTYGNGNKDYILNNKNTQYVFMAVLAN